MNWLTIGSNIAFALIAALLSVLGLVTFRKIRYLNVCKSFWIPIVASGILFSISSIITIFNESVISLTSIVETGQITQLIAICFLAGSLYSYSRTITKSIPEKYIVPEADSISGELQVKDAPLQLSEKATSSINNQSTETAFECSHHLGYLSTFPPNSSIPEECLSCDKVIECKYP